MPLREQAHFPLLDVCTVNTAKVSQKLLFCQVRNCVACDGYLKGKKVNTEELVKKEDAWRRKGELEYVEQRPARPK